MEPTEAEKAQAARAQTFLYVLMAVMIGVPAAIFVWRSF